jgi:predicted RNA-binding protein YlxR (DUF448 family)
MRSDSRDALVRLATLDGAVVADFEGRLEGRGGYLHPNRDCLEAFVRSKVKVFRSLKRRIESSERRSIAQAIAARLE